jgi:hypothetical protein
MNSPDQTTVPLSKPIKRGDQEIAEITLRKPAAGELRGLKLMDVINMDVASLSVLLPRIATPTLTRADVEALALPDLLDIGVEVTNFFA